MKLSTSYEGKIKTFKNLKRQRELLISELIYDKY